MTDWNFADIFSAIADRRGSAPAVVDARGELSWADFERHTDALATALVARGLPRQAKVAVYQRNTREHLETYFACFKAGLVPVNVNYRYGAGELRYLFDDADIAAVIVDREFAELVAEIRPSLPLLHTVVAVGAAGPDVEEYAGLLATPPEPVRLAARRTGDDLLLIYTGGTTGLPKGVMWRQRDLFEALVVTGQKALDLPAVQSVADLVAGLPEVAPRGLSASPLMHSTGLLNQFMVLLAGGCAVMLPGRSFDAETLWRHVAQHRVTSVSIVGDAFARPMLAWLDDHPNELDLSALQLIVSSGAMWSDTVQEGLLRHLPQLTLYDAFGSSEGFGLGMSSRTAGQPRQTAQFRLGPYTRVLADDGHWIEPGTEGVGRTAVCGVLPLGYYKDPAKTAAAFPVIDGVRYSLAGDYVRVNRDGTLHLLGRGSACINTGGEKVYAEEVEEVLKEHPGIRDVACVGIPHPRFGSTVCVVVEAMPGAAPTAEDLQEFVRARLAGYKVPRHLVATTRLPRTALGKVDYSACRELAVQESSSAPAAR